VDLLLTPVALRKQGLLCTQLWPGQIPTIDLSITPVQIVESGVVVCARCEKARG
jgi:hypothetical protein